MIMTKSGIYFLGSDRKAQFFSPLETKENLHPTVPPFTILHRNKARGTYMVPLNVMILERQGQDELPAAYRRHHVRGDTLWTVCQGQRRLRLRQGLEQRHEREEPGR